MPFGEDGGLVQPEGDVTFGFKGVQISDDIKKLICACLNKNPSERPTATELVDAANQKLFRTTRKSRSLGKIIGIVCTLIAIGVGAWYLLSYQTKESRPEDLFEDALVWVNASSIDSVRTGIEKMDSLAKQNYEPAKLEMVNIIGPNSLTAEKAQAALSLAEVHFKEIMDVVEWPDTLTKPVLKYFDEAVDWAELSQDQKLMNICKNHRSVFIEKVIKYYDETIVYAQGADDEELEANYRQYRDAFKAAMR